MTNDVLEQAIEDYLRFKGYFTQHNVKYKPNLKGPAYSVHSDIDVIAINPHKKGVGKVIVVSCKAWHGGLKINKELGRIEKKVGKTLKTFREIAMPVWSSALKEKVKELTGQKNFTFILAVVKYNENQRESWEKNSTFSNNLKGCKIKLMSFTFIFDEILNELQGITPSHSELTRVMQFMKYSGVQMNNNKVQKSQRTVNKKI